MFDKRIKKCDKFQKYFEIVDKFKCFVVKSKRIMFDASYDFYDAVKDKNRIVKMFNTSKNNEFSDTFVVVLHDFKIVDGKIEYRDKIMSPSITAKIIPKILYKSSEFENLKKVRDELILTKICPFFPIFYDIKIGTINKLSFYENSIVRDKIEKYEKLIGYSKNIVEIKRELGRISGFSGFDEIKKQLISTLEMVNEIKGLKESDLFDVNILFYEFTKYSLEIYLTKTKLLKQNLDEILFQVIFSLICLHKKTGILHNDIHRKNILVDFIEKKSVSYKLFDKYYKFPENNVWIKIIDFGLSKPVMNKFSKDFVNFVYNIVLEYENIFKLSKMNRIKILDYAKKVDKNYDKYVKKILKILFEKYQIDGKTEGDELLKL